MYIFSNRLHTARHSIKPCNPNNQGNDSRGINSIIHTTMNVLLREALLDDDMTKTTLFQVYVPHVLSSCTNSDFSPK